MNNLKFIYKFGQLLNKQVQNLKKQFNLENSLNCIPVLHSIDVQTAS